MVTNVHVVTASTGEYSDREEYVVKVFLCEAKAQEFINTCSQISREFTEQCRSGKIDPVEELKNVDSRFYALDSSFDHYCNYGPTYTYTTVELCDD